VSLIANADALASRDCGDLLQHLIPLLIPGGPEVTPPVGAPGVPFHRHQRNTDVVRLAVPDGHAQRHTPAGLRDAGLEFDGYDENGYVRRPISNVPGLEVKVV